MKVVRFAALIMFALCLSFTASASADELEGWNPGLRLGLGPLFASAPADRMMTGQTLVAADFTGDGLFGGAVEFGYSGERNGRLAGRHFVYGGAFRYGGPLGLNALVHGIAGKTAGDRSMGLRVGGRVDVMRYSGVDVQYEWRSIDNGISDVSRTYADSGVRLVFWIDAIFLIRSVGAMGS